MLDHPDQNTVGYSPKFHDGSTPYYFAQHHNYTEEEEARVCAVRYLTNPDVKVLALGRAS